MTMTRRRTLIASASLALLLILSLAATAQLKPLPGLDGGELTEAQLNQGTVIVVVWASWSPRCRDIAQKVNRLHGRWNAEARVVTVNFQEARGAVSSFLANESMKAPVYLDGDGSFSKKHAVTTLPSLLIFKDGRNSFRGKYPDDPDAVIAQVVG